MAELSCERLIWLLNVQAILSKNINTYTFHIHVAAAFCITNENINIGTMKEMGDSENEANSFEVLSWLALPVAQFAPHPDMYGNGYINSQGYFQEVFNFSASAFDKQLQYRGQQTNFQGKDETTAEEKWAQWPHKTCTLLGPKVAVGRPHHNFSRRISCVDPKEQSYWGPNGPQETPKYFSASSIRTSEGKLPWCPNLSKSVATNCAQEWDEYYFTNVEFQFQSGKFPKLPENTRQGRHKMNPIVHHFRSVICKCSYNTVYSPLCNYLYICMWLYVYILYTHICVCNGHMMTCAYTVRFELREEK